MHDNPLLAGERVALSGVAEGPVGASDPALVDLRPAGPVTGQGGVGMLHHPGDVGVVGEQDIGTGVRRGEGGQRAQQPVEGHVPRPFAVQFVGGQPLGRPREEGAAARKLLPTLPTGGPRAGASSTTTARPSAPSSRSAG